MVLKPERIALDRLFEQARLQTGVPLHRGTGILPLTQVNLSGGVSSLRQLMQAVAEPGETTWVRDGDGYRLEVVPGVGKK